MPTDPTLTGALLTPIVAADPAGPRITYYDDSTGERIEVSAVTFANWVAKTANMIRDEFALGPGSRVAVALPAHWQTAAVLFGAWWAGCEVVSVGTPDTDLESVDLAFVTAGGVDAAAPEVVALSLDAFGMPVRDLPIGVTDYATSVRMHGDRFDPAGAGTALAGRSVAEVVADARGAAERSGLAATDRVLSTRPWNSTDELVDNLLAVFAAGASLVQVTAPDADAQHRRVDVEKVTRTLD
ncbi:TIGR03089 family protein [Rhodococcus sp. HNM0569]|uniref:TIGR03089 family protein n=1 Tax=Rhodococcus sp. HNM0569 TaxID=2716340 RepID=UPI00146B1865|nr:TIGR03089 family protein [Rhodococcus sp. HNM0569]